MQHNSTRLAKGCFGSILLKNSVSRRQENSQEFFDCLVRVPQIICVLLRCIRPDFHRTSTTPSYLEYKMTPKSQLKSPLISNRSFSTLSVNCGPSPSYQANDRFRGQSGRSISLENVEMTVRFRPKRTFAVMSLRVTARAPRRTRSRERDPCAEYTGLR